MTLKKPNQTKPKQNKKQKKETERENLELYTYLNYFSSPKTFLDMQELRNFSPLHTFWKKKIWGDVLVKKKNDIRKNKVKAAKKKMTMTANKKNL